MKEKVERYVRDGHLLAEAAARAEHLARKHVYWSTRVADPTVAGLLRRLASGEQQLAGEFRLRQQWGREPR